ncbi:putative oxidoreductase Ptalp [[Candida] railenensis]|uniref:Oxidoreductase Ptalp n=1 Tax=[Candida] railenensis TaxID=45579 RepID=A0A9P0VZC0_9ASCO|nr:putative oxidoreductase Ptalp [[Candida] railenensis]
MSIVLIGANYAGAVALETIFKEIKATGKETEYSVTVVSKSTHFYANPSSPRLFVEPEHLEKVFFSVEEYLKKHSNGTKYEFIHASVDKANFSSKTLELSGGKKLKYDYLVVASGSRADNPAFKLDGDYVESRNAVKQLNKTIKDSGSIAILGGGATGVETAAEIAYTYPKKNVTLFTGTTGPLAGIGKSAPATSKLEDLGVKIVNNKKFSSIDTSETGASNISFDDGSTEKFDLYIPSYGLYPNSSFIDSKYLNDSGYLVVNENLVVEGHPEVIGFGDIASITEKTVVDIKLSQTKPFTQTVKKNIFNQDVSLLAYARGKTTTLIPISKKGGIGLMFGWSVPNFLVKSLKAKDFMIPKAGDHFS